MECVSLEQRIYDWVKSKNRYCRSGEVEDAARAWGYMGSTATRKARHLAQVGKLFTREIDGKVEYTVSNNNPSRPSLDRIFQKKLI